MKTKSFAKHEIDRSWFVVDADDQVLGRIIKVPRFFVASTNQHTAHAVSDFVVVVNADKVKLTGKKETDKRYRHHTGWVGGLEVFLRKLVLSIQKTWLRRLFGECCQRVLWDVRCSAS